MESIKRTASVVILLTLHQAAFSQQAIRPLTDRVFPGEKVKIEQTAQLTSRISWDCGHLELNLVPMNKLCEKSSGMAVGYCSINDKGRLILHDMVSIVGLQLDGYPPVSRIVWDNREHIIVL